MASALIQTPQRNVRPPSIFLITPSWWIGCDRVPHGQRFPSLITGRLISKSSTERGVAKVPKTWGKQRDDLGGTGVGLKTTRNRL
jgi:hypothetical protein